MDHQVVTVKQKALAHIVADAINNGSDKSQAELIKQAGYSDVSAENPKIIFGTPGFKHELAKLGFSLQAADQQVNNLLVNGTKEETKLKAADLIYKRLGGYAPDRTVNISVKGSVEEFQKFADLRKKYEEELLTTLTNEEAVGDIHPRVDIREPDENGNGDSSGLPQPPVSIPAV